MKTIIVATLTLVSALPAAADQSLLEMLKKPASPALAAVLADDTDAPQGLDAQAKAAPADRRATRELRVEPVSVKTIELTRGRDVALPAYVKRD